MAIEEQLSKLLEVNLEIRDLLKTGAGGTAAASTGKSKPAATGKGKTKETPPPADDDLGDDTPSGGDDLDDDLDDKPSGDDLDDDLGDEPKFTADQVREKLMEVKNKISKDKALEFMKKQGKSASVGAIQPENFEAVMTACEKALKAAK